MKTKLFFAVLLVLALTAFLVWAVSAQRPEPQGPPPPAEMPPAPAEPPFPGLEGKPFAPFAAPKVGAQSVGAASIPLGQPGLSFRYVQTFGVTETPYISTTTHLNYPYGVGAQGNSIWVGELLGRRALRYNADGGNLAVIGRAGLVDHPNFVIQSVFDVAADSGGNIWLVDGQASHVLQFDPSGNFVKELGEAWNWGSGNDRFGSPNSIAFDSQGNIYVSDGDDWWRGDNGNHRIQVFNPDGTYKATLGTTGSAGTGDNQFYGPAHIAIYGDYLYVADRGNHRVQIYQITFSPFTLTYVATLGETGVSGNDNGHFDNPCGVAVDNNYIYVADTFNHRIQVFNRTTRQYVTTIGGYGSANGQFDQPYDVAVDASGYLYVADFENTRVQQFRHAGGTTWNWQLNYGVTDVPYVTDNQHFFQPEGVAIGADGSIYIAENYGRRLVKLAADGTPQWSTPDIPGVIGYSPNDVAVGQDGRVYVAAGWENKIRIYNPDGTLYASFGGGGNDNYHFDDPSGIGVAPNGDIYVADRWNHRVQIYGPNWAYKATMGVNGQSGSDNSHFNEPTDVAIDANGTIYVADEGNDRVQVFNSNRQYVRTIGGGGTGNDFGHFASWGPHRLAVDAQGRLYVSDSGNNRIQVFDASGAYLTTIGGSWGTRSGQLRGPFGVAVDTDGNVYVTDRNNHRIQKFAPGVPGWKQVNINGFGERWNQWISSLVSFKGHLYASGYQAYVWRLESDGSWSIVNTLGFGDPTNDEIDAMAVFGDHLYAATFTFVCDDPNCNTWHTNGPQFWRTADGTTWENVTPLSSIGSDYRWVPTVISAGGYLYAALDRGDWNLLGAEIWRTADGQTWQQIASGGFGDPYNTGVLSLVEYNGYLYAGTRHGDWQNDGHPNGPLGGEVWRYDGANWTRVNDPGFGDVEAHRVERLFVFNNALYAYISRVGGTSKGAEIWRCTATVCNSQSDWTKVADNGFGNPKNQYIFSGAVFDGHLYAAIANYDDGMGIWRTADGLNWEPVTPSPGLGDSNNAYVWLGAMAVHNNRLYLGTTNWANGGEVWKKTVTADFTASPTAGSPGTTVTFANLSGGDIITTTWDFGDGSSPLVSGAATVTHTYTSRGAYTVTLTVEDGVDTDTRTRPAYIQIARRLYLPLVLRNHNPLMALYDDFNDPAFDGFYNPLKWQFWGDGNYFSAQQQGGVMQITNTSSTPANTGLDLPLAMSLERTLRQVQRFQAKMKLSSGTSGTGAKIQIMKDENGSGWWAQCSLNAYGSQPDFGCDIVNYTPGNYPAEYGVGWPGPLAFDTWYTARIEIDPNTAQVCFYLDNNLLGCHVPNDAAALKAATNLVPRIGSWNGQAGATGIRSFDDVYITPAGP